MPEHFVVPGAQRSGTTLLYRLLDQHPEIEMAAPLRPEPKFFLHPGCLTRGMEAYAACFPRRKQGATVRGEKSTSYLENAEAPARVRALLPEAKVVIALRDPVERALSHYRFSVANGLEQASMEEAFYREAERRDAFDRSRVSASPYAYLERGLYVKHLPRWEECFGRARVRLVLFEAFARSPAEVRGIFTFLGVDAGFEPAMPPAPPAPAEIAHELRAFLVTYFAEATRELADRYGIDVGCWASVREPWAGGARGPGTPPEGRTTTAERRPPGPKA